MRGLRKFRSDYIAPAGVDYNNIEAKFQLSFKTNVQVFWGHGDLWVAYTQSPLANL
jgi:phospholipase A1